ncbi:OsmC family protein [Ethanoligenens harbinense]|uniref:OsmC family protein n=1 Tax=Ethanoligenens harbinense (strain DSM 18485 / JCM 12961 / CGMCC 1.5033 / YUAN-3) TaxID=663278 RepID=E6U4P1_ETHHY|nr:OsmC family protein [Ethanoligenens harbinense]ADU26669.1 OsmC family protein [Ethanoligenens harbinense YUAN-3]AVQ95787.1 OsmC family peroxiredoxin [Ethanoligenens harbinense YUAN-3]AYF38449.1 OsmC family peroxiredoxin [Ethanoligenens harbinense]AYF41194.1 OsmC family peroxiredoxin [Ethanoligenens harbinense]QCN92027.1 OsmC family peroxiredoxin [Ethanoligenens harbinense]
MKEGNDMVTSISEQARYKTRVEGNHALQVYADVSEQKGGKSNGFRPHDLLCASLAACLNITVRMLLEELALSYDSVKVVVDLKRENPLKTTFLYHVDIEGKMSEDMKETVIKKAADCSIHQTLSGPISFEQVSSL